MAFYSLLEYNRSLKSLRNCNIVLWEVGIDSLESLQQTLHSKWSFGVHKASARAPGRVQPLARMQLMGHAHLGVLLGMRWHGHDVPGPRAPGCARFGLIRHWPHGHGLAQL